MSALENENNSYNERFVAKTSKKISGAFNFSLEDKIKLNDILYECIKNVDIILLEEDKGNFDEYIELYTASMELEGLSNLTIKHKVYTLQALNRYLNKNIKNVSLADLKMYILHKKAKCTTNTLNTIITTIKTFFKYLHNEGYLTKDPSDKIKKLKQEKRLKKIIDDITLEKIRLAANNKRDRAIIEFLYSTGARVSELVSVNTDDINLFENSITVIGKGNKERKLYFSNIARFYILDYLKTRNDTSEALFVSLKSPHNRICTRTVQHVFFNIGKKLELPVKLHPHMLRHLFATNLAASADITVVQKLLGHENINTTMIYADTNKDKISYQYKASKL